MSDKQPVISFILPVYSKPPEVFRNCLKSLFDQSIKDFEVIVVFDGHDAELQQVAAEFPRAKTFVIDHGGAPKARNYGLAKAIGKYIWMFDSDCYIKPDHAKRMLEEFEAVPDADFVYAGFELTEGGGTTDGESFDPFSLQCGNYISSMAPIKREKAFNWDETLEAGQDWDYWLTAAERGLKGVWVEGSGFVTDTYKTGLSSDKWSAENRDDTIYRIRHKHGIPDREIGVYSMNYKSRAIDVAKILGADLIKPTGLTLTVYKTILNIGYSMLSRFEGIADDVTKIQYWLPGEIEALKEAKYSVVVETIKVSKRVTNLCNTIYEKNSLKDLGIDCEILPLPLSAEQLEKVSTSLPEKFSVLVSTDKAYSELLKDLKLDLPHINFGFNAGKVSEYSAFLSFYQFAALDNAMLMALVNGRHVISNVQSPHCGFVDPDQSWEKFKATLYEKIREISTKPFNQEAKEHYLEMAGPGKFREAIESLRKVPMEVL